VENQIITACLRRVASVRPLVAMVIAEALTADERALSGLSRLLEPADAELTLQLLSEVLEEAAGGSA
jgi:hypothetical protein